MATKYDVSKAVQAVSEAVDSLVKVAALLGRATPDNREVRKEYRHAVLAAHEQLHEAAKALRIVLPAVA